MTAPQADQEVTDDVLVGAWRGGDERAAAELVRRYTGALGRYLYGAGAPPGEIEDLVQEAFIRAFRALDRWRGDGSFRGWLFRIAGNLRKDFFRREGRRVVLPLAETDLQAVPDPEAEFEAAEAEQRLRDGIAELPRLQRAVFLLRAQQGLDYTEIAAAVGTTPGAARVHYHHAVKRLKGLLT